jgi:hypothetical protein
VPATESQDVKVKSHHRLDSLPAEDGYVVFGTGSGTHVFEVQPRWRFSHADGRRSMGGRPERSGRSGELTSAGVCPHRFDVRCR